MSATKTRKSRRSKRLSRRLWPTCLRGSSPDQAEEALDERPAADEGSAAAVGVAAASETDKSSATVYTPSPAGIDIEKMAAVTSQQSGSGDVGSDVGLQTINISGGGPYGFRLTDGDTGQLIVSKLRKRGRADEAGLREGDVLVTINGRSCQGLSCSQAMDLIDSAGQSLVIRINRGGGGGRVSSLTSSSSSVSSSSVVERVTSSSVARSHSAAQERAGHSLYMSPVDPVRGSSELFTPTSVTASPSSTIIQRSPRQQSHDDIETTLTGSMTSSTDSGITVTAPPGVDVQHDTTGRTFTLTFGAIMSPGSSESASHSSQTQGPTPLIWQPSRPVSEITKTTSAAATSSTVDEVQPVTTHNRPPQLARVLQESKDLDGGPESPVSPSSRTGKKVFIDSAFYDDPEHKYPTVEEQIALARRVALSVLAPANANSRGHKMFVVRRERSIRWEAGFNPDGSEAAPAEDDPNGVGSPSLLNTTTPATLTSHIFAPKLPSGETIVDPEKLDAMSSEELERVMLFEKKTTHTNVPPQVCFNLADDLRNMKGKGGRLFAKRQAKSESWAVGGGSDEADQTAAGDVAEPDAGLQTSTAELRLKAQAKSEPVADQAPSARCEAMPVNRLKEMIELPRAAMTPWDAAAKFGTVEPAFQHLDGSSGAASKRTPGGNGSGGSRVKSWTGNPEAAAALAAAMTSSTLQSKEKPGFQPVKFTVPPSPSSSGTGTVDS